MKFHLIPVTFKENKSTQMHLFTRDDDCEMGWFSIACSLFSLLEFENRYKKNNIE